MIRFCVRAAALSVGLALYGCSPGEPARVPPAPPVYTPEDAALFNDLFRPELFGYPGVTPPEQDRLLPDRVAEAHTVVPVRVVTVSLDGDTRTRNYSVVVSPTEAPLRGEPLAGSVTLTVAANSPIFSWLGSAARGWVGTRLLLFLRMYQDGPHFHGSVDDLAVRAAVLRARIPSKAAAH